MTFGQKIGNWQLTALLVISQLFWLLSWQRRLPNPLILAVAVILIALVMALYIGLAGNGLERLLNKTALRLLLWLFAMLVCVQTGIRFLTEINVLLEGLFSPLVVLISLLLVLAAFSALGMEAFCRGAFVLSFFVLAAFILLAAGAADQCRLSALQPPELDRGTLGGVLAQALPIQAEVVLYLLLRPMVATPGKRLSRRFLTVGVMLGVALAVLCGLALGDYAGISVYPFYALSRASDLTALSQTTPFYWLMLICSAALRTGAFFILGVRLWPFAKKEKQAKARWLHAAGLFAVYLVIYYSGGQHGWLDGLIGALMVGFLLLALFTGKGGKLRENRVPDDPAAAGGPAADGL